MSKRVLNPNQMAFMDNPVVRPAAQRTRKPRFRGEIPGQRALLMTGARMSGTQLQDEITHSMDRMPHQTMQDLWDQKLRESQWPDSSGQSLYESMQEHGFDPERAGEYPGDKEVRVYYGKTKRMVADKHHRIASAAEIERQGGDEILFPVKLMRDL